MPGEHDGDGAAPPSLRLPSGELLRLYDLQEEDPERIIALKESVYGSAVDREAFRWEYFGHPRASEIRVFVAEHEGEIVASTTRLPATLRVGPVDHPAYFNIDSMVHPQHRRRGRMRDLYDLARKCLRGAIFFSKGSSAQMYPLLMSIGHRDIVPNTHLVSYPSAARWLMSRLRLRAPHARPRRTVPAGFEDFRPIDRFDQRFEAFFERVAPKFPALFWRDAAFMNWRYVDVTHRRYMCFQREVAGAITSVVVLSVCGEQAHIVDLLWDPDREDAPARDVHFAQALFDEHEVVRVACFGTHPRLRDVLGRSGFLDRGETPRFSFDAPTDIDQVLSASLDMHVVDGDGDTEFS